MGKHALVVIIALCVGVSTGVAQVTLSGGTAVYLNKSALTGSPRAVNKGRPSFGWRTDLFLDGYVTEDVAALCNVRVLDDQYINFDYLAVRLTNLTPLRLNLQVGKFDMPFGNLAERRFPRRNPLFGLPVIHEYRTALPNHITTQKEVLANRGLGRGMRLLDLGIYDLGAMLFGSYDIMSYAAALTSGTISTTSYGYQNSNSDLGKIVRLAVTPMSGLTVGGAYAWGAYMDEGYQALPGDEDINAYQQRAAEFDFEFSRGHAVLYGEGVYSIWQVPLYTRDEEFAVLGYYLEGKYTLMPRLYVALRMSGLRFANVLLENVEQPWDYNVTEWEGGVGYFLDRDVLVKLVRRETRIYGGSMPKDNLTAVQLTVAY